MNAVLHDLCTVPLSPLCPNSMAMFSKVVFSTPVRTDPSRRVAQCLKTTSKAPFMYHTSSFDGDWEGEVD